MEQKTAIVTVYNTPIQVTFEMFNGAFKIISAKVGIIEETGAALEGLRETLANSLASQHPELFCR
jgi:hypothetical protein